MTDDKIKRKQNIQKLLEISRSAFTIDDCIRDRFEVQSCSEIMLGNIGTCLIIPANLDETINTTI